MEPTVTVRLSDVKTCFEEWIMYGEFTSCKP